jgi:hypothetical protein
MAAAIDDKTPEPPAAFTKVREMIISRSAGGIRGLGIMFKKMYELKVFAKWQ